MFINTTNAFYSGLTQILREGSTITVRGHEVKELRPHLVQVERPLERVYVIPQRNSNIFACIAETLWVVAGRDDLEFLAHYLPRALDFSDDGLTWRAAYGPRLRNWAGVDQLREVARLLNEDNNSRRAVAILFDPAQDYGPSKDIPCNNWLQFLIRDGKLHLHVCVRSNDVIWGFSGINTFEWSVLQEMMAHWTNTSVGETVYFISSFHLYARHYDRAQRILNSAKGRTLYEFGINSTPFSTPFEEFDATLTQCFSIENLMRHQVVDSSKISNLVSDNFLCNCLQMLNIYNCRIRGSESDTILSLLQNLPSNDFKIAAVEYFARTNQNIQFSRLNERERKFFDYFWSKPILALETESCSMKGIFDVLSILHHKKTMVYGDAWKKRGEVVGVFSNIARKYDRLEAIIVKGAVHTLDETLADTMADLCVYAAKYLTYLAENYPDLLRNFISRYDMSVELETYAHNLDGFRPVTEVLLARYNENAKQWADVQTTVGCYKLINDNFRILENILSGSQSHSPDIVKCEATADLALAAAHFLVLSCKQDKAEFDKFVDGIRAM